MLCGSVTSISMASWTLSTRSTATRANPNLESLGAGRSNGKWKAFDRGDSVGTRFDRIDLLDVDQHGNLDVVTCEENAGVNNTGLGLIWYEHPISRGTASIPNVRSR